MYKLYGHPGSGSAAIELALEQAGQPYRVVAAASWDARSEREALARANPLQQIPTLLLPDGSVLSESAAILIHLGLAHPASGLLPSEPAARAQTLRGLVFIAANCYSAISVMDFPERWTAGSDAAELERIRQGTRARLHRHWELFADIFPARPFLGGATPGALDHLATVVSRWSGARAHLQQARPELHAALLRNEAWPASAAVIARHWPG